MKVLIWFICIVVPSCIQVAFKRLGASLGGLPTLILCGSFIALARFLCRKWDLRVRKAASKSDLSSSKSVPLDASQPECEQPSVVKRELEPTEEDLQATILRTALNEVDLCVDSTSITETRTCESNSTKKSRARILPIALSFMLVIALAGCGWLYYKVSVLEEAIEDLDTKLTSANARANSLESLVSSTKSELSEANEQIDFLEFDILYYIGYQCSGGDSQYHHFSCDKIRDYSTTFCAPVEFWETLDDCTPCSCWDMPNFEARWLHNKR